MAVVEQEGKWAFDVGDSVWVETPHTMHQQEGQIIDRFVCQDSWRFGGGMLGKRIYVVRITHEIGRHNLYLSLDQKGVKMTKVTMKDFPEPVKEEAAGVWEHIQERAACERKKALEKYGEEAVLDGGHPEYNVFEYALNEVVGLIRYGDMMIHRVRAWKEDWKGPEWVLEDSLAMAYDVEAQAKELSITLLTLSLMAAAGGKEQGTKTEYPLPGVLSIHYLMADRDKAERAYKDGEEE